MTYKRDKNPGKKALFKAKKAAGGTGKATKPEKAYKKAVKADIKSLRGQRDPEAKAMKKGLRQQLKPGAPKYDPQGL